MLNFKEYSHITDFPGQGIHLYENAQPTSYYSFLKEGDNNWEIFYGNGFFIAREAIIIGEEGFRKGKVRSFLVNLQMMFPIMGLNVKFDEQQYQVIRNHAKKLNWDTNIDLSWLDDKEI